MDTLAQIKKRICEAIEETGMRSLSWGIEF